MNNNHLFIRGSTIEQALDMEEDQVKELNIVDQHLRGSYTESNPCSKYDETSDGFYSNAFYGDNGEDRPWRMHLCSKRYQISQTSGSEVRPKNMKTTFIIKIK